MSELFNFMRIEDALVKRLEFVTQNEHAGIGAWCKKVATAQYLSFVQEAKQITPAVYVVYQGKTILATQGSNTKESHRWAVVLAVKNAADQTTNSLLNGMAGLYLTQIQAALQGFIPEGAIDVLKEITPPSPYYGSGFAYFPLMFEAPVLISSKFGSGITKASNIKRGVLTDKATDY